jgi:hypothetical protein
LVNVETASDKFNNVVDNSRTPLLDVEERHHCKARWDSITGALDAEQDEAIVQQVKHLIRIKRCNMERAFTKLRR